MTQSVYDYLERGWAVFPIHSVQDKRCTCNKTDCRDPGKHPLAKLAPNGFKSATKDASTVKEWVSRWGQIKPSWAPNEPNWAIATGPVSGLFVLDIDPKNGGNKSLTRLEQENGDLPPTLQCWTGGDGTHYYFTDPGGLSIGSLADHPGIDFRCAGGYVLLEPSKHKSSNEYRWLDYGAEVLQAPEWLVMLCRKRKGCEKSSLPADPFVLTMQGEEDLPSHPGCEAGGRNATLCRLAGIHAARGDSLPSIITMALAWNRRCNPPKDDSTIIGTVERIYGKHHAGDGEGFCHNVTSSRCHNGKSEGDKDKACPDVENIEKKKSCLTNGDNVTIDSFVFGDVGMGGCETKSSLHPDALSGLAGDIVKAITPETEADPAGILLAFLAGAGSIVGRNAWLRVGATTHYPSLFCVLVGKSGDGKGEAVNGALYLLRLAEPDWARQCVQAGIASGEALIDLLKDDVSEVQTGKDGNPKLVVLEKGATDKRLLWSESEFSRIITSMRREGSTLSNLIRQAWDGSPLQCSTKGRSIRASEASVSLIGQITPHELAQCLRKGTETSNGFANRFLWCMVASTKDLPEGGNPAVLDVFLSPLKAALAKAKAIGEMTRSDEGKRHWENAYRRLKRSDDLGAERARPQVLRLSMLYALLDGSAVIGETHLRGALAVWDYCQASARQCFTAHNTPKQPTEIDIIHNIILNNPGITRREIQRRRHAKDDALSPLLNQLQQQGQAYPVTVQTDGRPSEQWYPGRCHDGTMGQCDKSDKRGADNVTMSQCHIVTDSPKVADVGFTDVTGETLEEGESEAGLEQVTDVIQAVREFGGRFVLVGGGVAVEPTPSPAIARAVAVHQAALRSLLEPR